MTTRPIVAMMLAAALAACGAQSQPGSDNPQAAAETPASNSDQPVSILRPEVEQPGNEQAVIAPLSMVIGFPGGGSALDADAVSALENLLQSEQLALGGPIIVRGHSDSAGSDQVNLDASQDRAIAVVEWLLARGIDPDRIDVIVFGEQNPVAANARPDGSADEAGRAANRRVEIEIPTLNVVEPDRDDGSVGPAD